MEPRIFVPGVGQYDNLGDIILRRQLIEWLKPLGRLHVYIGNAPPGYGPGLGLRSDDALYRSFPQWYVAGVRSALRGNTSYVFKPGEIQLTLVGMKEHLGMLPMLALVRAGGGTVARVGAGSRNFSRLPASLMRPSIALSDLTVWRDGRTAGYLRGRVMPDLAFGEGGVDDTDASPTRDRLVVSMRSDRALPGEEWIDAVRTFAARRGLRITVVTQVLRDRERSRQLGRLLGGSVLDWDGTDHSAQEQRLRGAYRETVLAVSDRLHVLVTAFTEGAVPIALLVDRSDKIERHFRAAGIEGIGVPSEGLSRERLDALLERAVGRRDDLQSALVDARTALRLVRADLERLFEAEPTALSVASGA
ncbi:polysaccharide pyruvyl transferase family protein [Agromyces binzhouensis]|uniref:polysaccharide pyruvyl transferase family protein n=1 Tax=Agromyces binzhouensis TaxID=1817495 RepID=UPI003645A4C9